MTPMRVSVVIPVYNGERFVAEALASIAAQKVAASEVIVVDDGSTDGSAEIATRAGAKVVRSARRGATAARNTGIEHASGDVLAFLDQDDEWTPDKLALQLPAVAGGRVTWSRGHLQAFLAAGTQRPPWLGADMLTQAMPGFVPGVLLIHRAALERVGLFDPAFEGADDIDWVNRAQLAGEPCEVRPEVILRWRIHNSNQSADVARMRREILAAVRAQAHRHRS